MNSLIPLYALFAPFFAWPIELFLPYPYIVEELIKAYLASLSSKKDFKTVILSGVFFALSETVLYTFNFNLLGTQSLFFTRLLTTSFLHSLTFLILFLSHAKGKKIFVAGIIFSMTFHFFFNLFLATL